MRELGFPYSGEQVFPYSRALPSPVMEAPRQQQEEEVVVDTTKTEALVQ